MLAELIQGGGAHHRAGGSERQLEGGGKRLAVPGVRVGAVEPRVDCSSNPATLDRMTTSNEPLTRALERLIIVDAGVQWQRAALAFNLAGVTTLMRVDFDGHGTWNDWMLENGGVTWAWLNFENRDDRPPRLRWEKHYKPAPEFVRVVGTWTDPT